MPQVTYPNSMYDSLYYDKTPAETKCACTVRIGDGLIELSYDDDDGGIVRYIGTEEGQGHFHLKAPEVNGKATLHSFDGSEVLEGFWVENGERGMWRVTLNKDDAIYR